MKMVTLISFLLTLSSISSTSRRELTRSSSTWCDHCITIKLLSLILSRGRDLRSNILGQIWFWPSDVYICPDNTRRKKMNIGFWRSNIFKVDNWLTQLKMDGEFFPGHNNIIERGLSVYHAIPNLNLYMYQYITLYCIVMEFINTSPSKSPHAHHIREQWTVQLQG